MGKVVITDLYNTHLLFLFDNDFELQGLKAYSNSDVDTVYIGRIDEINKGLNAAFVSVGKKKSVFVPLNEIDKKLQKCGNQIPVQIKTDALKTKLPSATTEICIPGEYCVIHIGGKGIHFSKKISNDDRKLLTASIRDISLKGLEEHGIVIRTNAVYLAGKDITPLKSELKTLIRVANRIRQRSQTAKAFTVLYKNDNNIGNEILKLNTDDYTDIVTDDRKTYEKLSKIDVLKNKNIRLYTDEAVSLVNLYSLRTHLDRILDKNVYLKSGGYLIIESTEAFTVIDVNSGKVPGRNKDPENYYLKVNREAAAEVARQMILRNLSGIILVDFINMSKQKNNDTLMKIMADELAKDKLKPTLVDMTKLGIVEITRKKVDLSLDKIIML
ncbi:MAG: ribonuclease E/G [Lachnospiraceae bacterium]|nr:ribonuclease E/G [Lachnospiraceae bacterium]